MGSRENAKSAALRQENIFGSAFWVVVPSFSAGKGITHCESYEWVTRTEVKNIAPKLTLGAV